MLKSLSRNFWNFFLWPMYRYEPNAFASTSSFTLSTVRKSAFSPSSTITEVQRPDLIAINSPPQPFFLTEGNTWYPCNLTDCLEQTFVLARSSMPTFCSSRIFCKLPILNSFMLTCAHYKIVCHVCAYPFFTTPNLFIFNVPTMLILPHNL